MNEITKMPVKVSNGSTEIEVYESKEGFCMTTEFLGRCIGYAHPRISMARLFRRHKDALEPHQFVVTATTNSGQDFVINADNKLGRGRPSYFYDKGGIVKAFMLAGTQQAKEYGPKVIDCIEHLEAKRITQVENYWFARRPHWPPIRARVLAGECYRSIAEALQISRGRVARAVRSMIRVGILAPSRVVAAQRGQARKAALKYGEGWGQRQLSLFSALPS